MTIEKQSDLAAGQAREPGSGRRRRQLWLRLLFLLPIVIFGTIAGYFLWGLSADRDPSEVPSALIGKPVPDFALPPVEGLETPGLSKADLEAPGKPVLLNVFASWCVPCRVEHPIFMRLAEQGTVPIYGVNYKDRPADARQWLQDLGNPYDRIGADRDGRAGIQLGVYGVPETYVIGPDGTIRYKHVGPIQARDWNRTIKPLLDKLRE